MEEKKAWEYVERTAYIVLLYSFTDTALFYHKINKIIQMNCHKLLVPQSKNNSSVVLMISRQALFMAQASL